MFGIEVSGSTSFDAEVQNKNNSIFGDSNVINRATHSFHQNVLQALDKSSNPLHVILGTGQVREYLAIAKEFRNRWKDAEETASSSPDRTGPGQHRYERLLRELKLEEMLRCILVALAVARGIAEDECVKQGPANATKIQPPQAPEVQNDMPWMSMPDAMDWD